MRHLSFIYPSSSNLGDDIQTLAATRFLTNPDYIDRDRMALYRGSPAKIILNGWWTHNPQYAFPPPDKLDCLPISMHIHPKAQAHFKECRNWFKDRYVLARDPFTAKFLQSIGVKSEFVGCLTLTLPRNEPEKRRGVFIVDAHEVSSHLVHLSHKTSHTKNHLGRRDGAYGLLWTYQNAELVITKRLHCALPCAAMGTPVILIGDNNRFDGMERFVVRAKSVQEFEQNRERLIEQAKNFDRTHIETAAEILTKTVQEWL